MLSQVDIDDWDAKQPERVKAVNHLGWAVEVYSVEKGWTKVSSSFTKKEDAIKRLLIWKTLFSGREFRVYEQVNK